MGRRFSRKIFDKMGIHQYRGLQEMDFGISQNNDELEQGMLVQPPQQIIRIEEGLIQSPMSPITTPRE